MLFPGHRKTFPVDPRFQSAVHTFQKIIAVLLNVKADQVRPQQAIHQLALIWANTEHFRVRPGNMPEDRHSRVRTFSLYQARQQSEVVVLRQQ